MIRISMALIALLVLAGCGEDNDPSRLNTFVPLTAIEASVDPSSAPAGTVARMTVIGDFSGDFTRDVTDSVLLGSSDPNVATVSMEPGRQGVITPIAPGTVTLTAESDGLTDTVDFTVTDATIETLSVSPPSISVPAGMTRSFTAEGTFSDGTVMDLTGLAEWTSSDPAVATISNDTDTPGLATAVAPGAAIITGTFGGVSATADVIVTEGELERLEINPITPDLPDGFSLQFAATAFFSDSTSEDVTAQAVWTSSAPTVATISNAAGENGLATAVSVGVTSISAAFEGLEEQTALTVTNALLDRLEFTSDIDVIDLGAAPIRFSTTGFFTDATELDLTEQVTFTSSDTGIAEVSNVSGSRGIVTPIAAGTFTLTAERDGIAVSRDIAVQ
ncbi:Ig-like domain-containing protein [Desulfuromonas sp. TF]|uniref:Ig-like domain-containing protein n=1 Tax=Desulfuromonas sp. TF TaxID=1232410 RepID=UPI000415544D|nr:Ig-like domain-containing protein [Desulfuromonas sp. TF]